MQLHHVSTPKAQRKKITLEQMHGAPRYKIKDGSYLSINKSIDRVSDKLLHISLSTEDRKRRTESSAVLHAFTVSELETIFEIEAEKVTTNLLCDNLINTNDEILEAGFNKSSKVSCTKKPKRQHLPRYTNYPFLFNQPIVISLRTAEWNDGREQSTVYSIFQDPELETKYETEIDETVENMIDDMYVSYCNDLSS